ncbi:MAG: UDP-N-acetylmuramoyl-L-alanyl-D-glutamate--2,6-diaminopimelate ligase [bacterium]
MNFKILAKKIIPEKILNRFIPLYHKILAYLAAIIYRFPSDKMIIIGVTGTKGKSSTTIMIAKVLEKTGENVGFASTAGFQIGKKNWINDKKMTMLGRFQLQKLLRDMSDAGCKYAVIETSSEGIKQSRHKGIDYDYLVFTNLSPEHIESHKGFDNYKKAKLTIFKELIESKRKEIGGKKIRKVIVVNNDDKYANEFLKNKADVKITYALENQNSLIKASELRISEKGTDFKLREMEIHLRLAGGFNVYNALAATAIGLEEGLDMDKIAAALEEIKVIPGRMEFINEGQDYFVVVDYAHEPSSMEQVFKTLKVLSEAKKINRIIHIFGSCGGGRDKSKRRILGRISAKNADISIITNEDPYDEKPEDIIEEIKKGVLEEKNLEDFNLFAIIDRKESIRKAFELAGKNDLVLITGKGCEQTMCVKQGKQIRWDDRETAREEIKKLSSYGNNL